MPRYAELIYNGFWFSPERRMLQALIDESQKSVSGRVRMKLYKGNVSVIGRKSPNSLYSQDVVTFEDDQGVYDQFDAQGFIKLNALGLRLGARPVDAAAASLVPCTGPIRHRQRRRTMRRREVIAAAFVTGIAPAAHAAQTPSCSNCSPPRAARPARRPTRCSGQLSRRPDVIALAWHVDYWNHLGWRDRFASRDATTRQRAYARRLGSGVFTPALVVDGTRSSSARSAPRSRRRSRPQAFCRSPVALSRSEDAAMVEVGAARARYWRNGSSTTRSTPPMSPPVRTTASGCANTASCVRSRRWRRMGWRRATVSREASRSGSGSGDPGAVGGPSYPRGGGPAAA